MKKRVISILNLILALFVTIFVTGYTFAWFANSKEQKVYFSASSASAYFAGGNGTEDNAYKISEPRHLYNLAWLQDTDKIRQKLYFKLVADLDMSGYVLPPIGTHKNPFIGVFDGCGHVISNLVVSTNEDVLTNPATAEGGFSHYVGMFGRTDRDSNITNFILDNPVVEAAADGTYSSGESLPEDASSTLTTSVGLAIGYVAHEASAIGVIGGKLLVGASGYRTFNGIIGAYNKTIAGEENGDDEDGGEDAVDGGDTGYLVPQKIHEKASGTSELPGYFSTTDTLKTNMTLTANSSDALGLGSFSLVTGDKAISFASKAPYIEKNNIHFYHTLDGNTYGGDGNYYEVDITKANNYYTSSDADYVERNNILKHIVFKRQRLTSLEYYLDFSGKSTATAGGSQSTIYYEDGSTNKETTTVYQNIVVKIDITHASEEQPAEIFMIGYANNERNVGIYKATNSAISLNNPMQKLTISAKEFAACYFKLTEPATYYIGSESSGFRIYYLSVVGVENGQESNETKREIFPYIDFIYEDVTISDGSLVDGDDEYIPTTINISFGDSDGVINISENGAFIIMFYRDGDRSGEFYVGYNIGESNTASTSVTLVKLTSTFNCYIEKDNSAQFLTRWTASPSWKPV